MKNIKKLISIRNIIATLKHPVNKESGLANPVKRAEIPADFPGTISPYSAAEALAVIEAQLAKRGTSLKDVKRINIAYPHKHKGLHPKHHNSAEERALAFQEKMQKIAPDVEWVLAQALSERKHLDRSGDQSGFHALTGKQVYDVYMPAQVQPFPFADKKRTGKEYFVIVDNTIEQGTTIANLMSFIAHNNAEVLMIQADRHMPFAQRRGVNDDTAVNRFSTAPVTLGPAFNDAARNNGRVPQLAVAFSKSAKEAGDDWSPEESIEKFEAALQRHGNSVFALTEGEAAHLLKTMYVEINSFPALVKKLEKKKPEKTPKAPRA